MGACRICRNCGKFLKKLTAYLGYYREYWNALLKPEDHRHEIGERTEGCCNCTLNGLAEKMSDFETACFNWYCLNVNQFAMESGLIPQLIQDIGFTDKGTRGLFLRGLNIVYQGFEQISVDRAKRDSDRMRNRD